MLRDMHLLPARFAKLTNDRNQKGGIAYHTHDAIKAGATHAELLEMIGVGLLMGGGPGSIYAAHALDAVDQSLAESPTVNS